MTIDWDKALRVGVDGGASKIREIQEVALEIAKTDAPFLTGNHRDTIVGFDNGELDVGIQTENGYGGYLELGTAKMEARPHIQPAVLAAKRQVLG
jgi:bacillopeptidase F (M6 metalloprotease family)